MAWYRLYCLEGAHIANGEDLEADSDEEAIKVASELHPTTDCELWRGTKKVASIRARATNG